MKLLIACAALVLVSSQSMAEAHLADVLAGYREVATALAKDNFPEASTKAAALQPLAEEMARLKDSQERCYTKVAEGARALSLAASEKGLRLAMSVLSEGAVWLVKSSPTLQGQWQLYKCPMVGGGAFQFWMQPIAESIANPYMGQAMLQCGVRKAWAAFP